MEKTTPQTGYQPLQQLEDPENPTTTKSKPCKCGWKRKAVLLLGALMAGGWFLRPHCHHVHRIATGSKSIEDRVHTILTQTPLIGIIQCSENDPKWKITDML